MLNFLNIIIYVTIIAPFSWTIYVPEHTNNGIESNVGFDIHGEQTVNKNKPFPSDLLQIGSKYQLKLNADEDSSDSQQSIFAATQAKNNQQEIQQQFLATIQMQQKSYDIDDDVANEKNHTSNGYDGLEAQPTGLAEHNVRNNDVILFTISNDSGENDLSNTLPHKRQRRQLSDFLIAPNTRWCGRGNTANGTYNHLGGASMADKCCRTHDHCKYFIPAMSNRFDLFNYRPYTLSHCNCDRRFRTCLKMANDEDANTIGKLFFNLVQTQCFILAKEVLCQQRSNDGSCVKEHIKQKAYLRNNKKY